MPVLTFGETDNLLGKYFNPETMEFQDEPIKVEVPTLPDKLTQEELRFMRIVAESRIAWTLARGYAKRLSEISGNNASRMEAVYTKMQDAQQVASLFVPKKRITELATYAKKHPYAVLYTCDERRVR